jgi:2-polyprenyl-3-methyl-5-hydroxy-6-metoxy-1,4-benzoquinol methylase
LSATCAWFTPALGAVSSSGSPAPDHFIVSDAPVALPWEEAAECGVCGSREWRLVGTICQRRYVECRQCAVHRLYDRVAEQRLDLLYGAGYYPAADLSASELQQQLQNPTFDHRRARLDACLARRERRILELGCGDGNFLAVLRERGWQVSGQEFSAEAMALVERRHHIPVLVGDITKISPDRPFPVVAAYHVFEHVYHPALWLERVRSIIEPRGLLHLQVPNGGSLTRQLTRQAWAGFVFPEHVYLYSPKTLCAVLERHRFTPLSVTTWDPWHGPGTVARSLTNVVHRIASGRLPWTDTIGDRCSQPVASAPRSRPSSLRAISRSGLEFASANLARIEAAAGRGAVVDIVAARTV